MKKDIKKVIRDGNVAVLISPGFGAGWYSWNSDYPEMLFHPKLVEMVETGRKNEITDEWMQENLGIDIHPLGAEDLDIIWLKEGTAFCVEEYDGSESIKTSEDFNLTA